MDKYELLQRRAENFMWAPDEYAGSDEDVADLRDHFLPWYKMIMNRKIQIPCIEYSLHIYFSNPDYSPIAEKYAFAQSGHPLHRASSEFTAAIKDWPSMDWWKESHKGE
jgi:hypothetical protein